MKFPLPVWVVAFSCCVQKDNCRRTQVRTPLDARDTAVRDSDHSPIGTPTEIYDANEAGAQDVPLQISTNEAGAQDVPLQISTASHRQQQSNPTVLLEVRHSDVGKDEKISKDKHDEEHLNSPALLKHRGSNAGLSKNDRKNEHDKEQSNTMVENRRSNVEKDKGKYNKEQSGSEALLKDLHSDGGEHDKNSKDELNKEQSKSTALLEGRHAHVGNVGKPEKKSNGKPGIERQKSALSDVMSPIPAENFPRFGIAGCLCLLSLCGCCLFQMVFKKESLFKPETKMMVRADLGSSNLSLTVDDTAFSQITLQSALAQPFGNQCLLQTAQVWTRQGAVDVIDLQAGSELIDTEGDAVKVKSSIPKPDWERDFVEVELEEGEFEVTSSHLLEASTNSNVWYPWLAGDLRTGLFVKTDIGSRQIIDIHKKPRRPVNVMQVELERNATFWLNANGVWVSIFGAQVEEFVEQVHNLVYLKPPCSLYCIRGSASEPNVAHSCGGACYHWKTLGNCKFGQDCVDCHVFGCTKAKMKMGKRQRRRVKRAFSDDPGIHIDSCEK